MDRACLYNCSHGSHTCPSLDARYRSSVPSSMGAALADVCARESRQCRSRCTCSGVFPGVFVVIIGKRHARQGHLHLVLDRPHDAVMTPLSCPSSSGSNPSRSCSSPVLRKRFHADGKARDALKVSIMHLPLGLQAAGRQARSWKSLLRRRRSDRFRTILRLFAVASSQESCLVLGVCFSPAARATRCRSYTQ